MMHFFAALLDGTVFPQNDQSSANDIVTIIFTILGLIGVIVVVYSGIQLIISQGNSEKVATARRGIIYAIVGLVVIISSWTIVSFIVNRFA